MQEVDNAFQQTTREISQRYDLKDSGATIELSKGDKLFSINAPADFVSKQIIDVLSSKLIKRGIDLKAVSWDAPPGCIGRYRARARSHRRGYRPDDCQEDQ